MNAYQYYLKNIKPIEKKYSRICYLSSLFKIKYLENKKAYYNTFLSNYYKNLHDNPKDLQEILNKFNQKLF